jgi:uncharacterized protein YyaL (SSP411 family)
MTLARTPPAAIAWMPWAPAAFARARAERTPILLSIVAEWCAGSREMARTTYRDPAVAAAVAARFVPVRVDADARPDIAERYALGGWPTTAFLTAEGAVVAGGTFFTPVEMVAALDRVTAAFEARGEEMARAGATREGDGVGSRAPLGPAALAEMVFAAFDARDGRFGTGPLFPLEAPVRLALSMWHATGDPRYQQIALTALDAMGWGPLYDEAGGGFFRCAHGPRWQQPRTEKLLGVNAALLDLYVDAGFDLDVARYRERAADVLRYVQTWLADPVDGGWFASQAADEAYYAAPAEARPLAEAPAVSATMFADGNGAMASAALRAARRFGDEGLRDFALQSLERVLLSCYKPGDGVAHYHEGGRRVRGLLADQVALAEACLEAFDTTGQTPYEMMAEELMHYAVREMWNAAGGGFHDRAPQPDEDAGRLRQPLAPFVTNCAAAAVLARLGRSSGDHEFTARAADTLRALTPAAAAQGPLAAHYLLALRAADR